MSIEVIEVTKIYGAQKALDGISFSVNSGEVVGLLGPNGAGKSTLMKIITGFILPSSGTAKIQGFDIMKDPLEVKKRLGYLPEHNPLYTDMYVKEYLEFVARIYSPGSSAKRAVEEIINKTGLSPERQKKIGELSKGYRQRVGLAQALIHDPEVLIFDEPTSGLDPNQIVEIRNLISEVGKEKTVILSTHIMQEVEAICDRVVIIDHGTIVANDATDRIHTKTDHLQKILVEFQGTVSLKGLEQIPGVAQVFKVSDACWVIQGPVQEDLRPKIFNYAVENKLTVLSQQVQEKSLEEIFWELTNKAH